MGNAEAIRTGHALAIITEINEALSLTNEPGLIANAALDAVTGVLRVTYAWLQTEEGGILTLVAGRGLSPAMESQLTTLGRHHPLRQRVLGRGETISFSDLSSAGKEVPAAFNNVGLSWLVAAPMMTHRAVGILGVASEKRKSFDRDLPALVRVIGGMIGGALQRQRLGRLVVQDSSAVPDNCMFLAPEPSIPPPQSVALSPRQVEVPQGPPRKIEETRFQRDERRVASFKNDHRDRQF